MPSLVADNGVNAFWIEGTARPLAGIDLTAQQVSVARNGVTEHEGVGGNVDGGPLGVLAWLANMLNRQGEMLKKGQKISTGTLTPVIAAAPGDNAWRPISAPSERSLSVFAEVVAGQPPGPERAEHHHRHRQDQ